jgi:hypothetical protein
VQVYCEVLCSDFSDCNMLCRLLPSYWKRFSLLPCMIAASHLNCNSLLDAGPSREFRVVRDNRVQHGAVENRPELGNKGSPNVQMSDRRYYCLENFCCCC